MSDRNRLFLLILVMTLVVLVAGAVGIYFLYDAAFEQRRDNLMEAVQIQTRLIEAVARFDSLYSRTDHYEGWESATLSKIADAQKKSQGFGETGEFTVAKKEDGQIVYLLRHRHEKLENPEPLRFNSRLDRPMQLALSGLSGTIVDLDRRGVKVLAAYAPISILNWGFVAEVDIWEIRSPFIKAAFLASIAALFAMVAGAVFFHHLTNPLLKKLSQSEAETRRDKTERKIIVDALREKEMMIQSIVETAIDAVITIDENGIIQSANSAVERLFGYKPEEVIGQNVGILMPSPHSKQHDQYIERYKKTGEKKIIGFGREETARRKDGNIFPIRLSISEFFLGDKRLFTGFIHDMTNQKTLEQRVLQSERLAVIGKMAAKVAHEVRNPLSSISLNAEMLQEEIETACTENNEEAYALIESMISEIDRVAALTDEYLQFSRLPQSMPIKGNISDLIHEVLDLCLPELHQKNISLGQEKLIKDLNVSFDYSQMRRVLLNLIRNAIEAMPSGGALSVSAEKNNTHAIINISDTGSGIPEKMVSQIFDPFFTTKDFGTGLGLAISQQIINEHQGAIVCESEMDKGTTFRIELPL